MYHRPATRFVADFIGHGVSAPATIPQADGRMLLEAPLGPVNGAAAAQAAASFAQGGPRDLLLRADDVAQDDEAPVKGEMMRKAFRGSEFLYTLRLASGGAGACAEPSRPPHRRVDRCAG
jgi:iron(III) transport system ATP-binding protein